MPSRAIGRYRLTVSSITLGWNYLVPGLGKRGTVTECMFAATHGIEATPEKALRDMTKINDPTYNALISAPLFLIGKQP